MLRQVLRLTSDRPCSSKYSRKKGILRLVVNVSTCSFKPGNFLLKPVPSVANDNHELQQQVVVSQQFLDDRLVCELMYTVLDPKSVTGKQIR